MKKGEFVQGVRFKIKNSPSNNGARRTEFICWPYGSQDMVNDSLYPSNGEIFEVILPPRRKNLSYNYPEVSAKFVAIRRMSDSKTYETYYANILHDTEVI